MSNINLFPQSEDFFPSNLKGNNTTGLKQEGETRLTSTPTREGGLKTTKGCKTNRLLSYEEELSIETNPNTKLAPFKEKEGRELAFGDFGWSNQGKEATFGTHPFILESQKHKKHKEEGENRIRERRKKKGKEKKKRGKSPQPQDRLYFSKLPPTSSPSSLMNLYVERPRKSCPSNNRSIASSPSINRKNVNACKMLPIQPNSRWTKAIS